MKIISHRGNINGALPHLENTQEYVEKAFRNGFDVEIDLWFIDNFYIGHDRPERVIDFSWLWKNKNRLWIHCKDLESFTKLSECFGFVFFYHETDSYSWISNGLIWAHNKTILNNRCIIPSFSCNESIRDSTKDVFGICTDFPRLVYDTHYNNGRRW